MTKIKLCKTCRKLKSFAGFSECEDCRIFAEMTDVLVKEMKQENEMLADLPEKKGNLSKYEKVFFRVRVK